MPVNIVVTQETNGTVHVYFASAGPSPTFTEATMPSGVTFVSRRADKVEYLKRHYIVGPLSRNLVFVEQNNTLHKMGMTAPVSAPTLADGGAGSLTGLMVGYVTFRHKIGSTVVHESNGSPASGSLNITNKQISWSSIVGSDPEGRATHVALYRSVDGALPRFVTELAIGTTIFTDTVATAALGAVLPTANGVPPQARFVEKYHDRVWFAGVTVGGVDFPERIYFSEIGLPEAVATNNFVSTRDGETVTSIKRVLDQLGIFGRVVTYDLQGYTVTDFVMRKLNPSVGCLSHFANVNISERLIFPAVDGVYVFNGASFEFQMDELRDYWRDDFEAKTSAFNDSAAADDREFHVYKLLIKQATTPKSFYYVGHYLDSDFSRGNPLQWTFDIRAREDNSVGLMDVGSGQYGVFTGSCDGKVRRENVAGNADDDGDTYLKKFVLQSKLDFFEDLGGGMWHAKRFSDLDVYMKAENNAWTLKVYAGEEDAADALTPNQTFSPAASKLTVGSQTFLPKQQHYFRLVSVAGKGLAVRVEVSSPLDVSFRGFGGVWQDTGVSSRLRQT